jgi:hypothetical protein
MKDLTLLYFTMCWTDINIFSPLFSTLACLCCSLTWVFNIIHSWSSIFSFFFFLFIICGQKKHIPNQHCFLKKSMSNINHIPLTKSQLATSKSFSFTHKHILWSLNSIRFCHSILRIKKLTCALTSKPWNDVIKVLQNRPLVCNKIIPTFM